MLSNTPASIRDWSKIITLLPSIKTDNIAANNKGEFKPVKSSMMEAGKFNPGNNILSIKSLNSSKIYIYNCLSDTYSELLNAKSKGKFFSEAKKAGLITEFN